jgi:lysophospholipase L1-like esterase
MAGTGTGGVSGAGAAGSGGSGTPAVRIVGRTAPGTGTGGAVRFSWPGVDIHARFTGTQVSMNLNDGSNKNRFTVVVDGGTPKTVTTTSAQVLSLASGLTDATHDIVIWRNTEASPGGVTQFLALSGFSTGGALLAPAAAPDRRIEVIGDSLSVGAGVEGTSTTCSPDINAFTNNYLAYGSIAARSVQADVVTIAWSGIGVYVSYGGTAPTMPQRYDYAVPNDNTPWDFSQYQPHVVVINLGTNDFYYGNPGQPYVDAYVSFVKHIRSKYAIAHFILIDMYGGDRLTLINNVVSTLKSSGESQVEALSFSSVPNNNTACNQHPNATAQQAMGNILTTRLKSLMGW